jgi:hypothetical protein
MVLTGNKDSPRPQTGFAVRTLEFCENRFLSAQPKSLAPVVGNEGAMPTASRHPQEVTVASTS